MNSIATKLAAFRRRHYFHQILRGGLLLVLVSGSLFLLVAFAEGNFWLSPGTRAVLFWGLVATALFVTGRYLLWPATRLLGLTQPLSDDDAARLIGKHFPEVNDRLLNLLQLGRATEAENTLVAAAIEQKTASLQPFPFPKAVDVQPNRRLARWLALPTLLLVVLLAVWPEFLASGTSRLLNYDTPYTPPPPFNVTVENLPKELVAGTDTTLDIRLAGREIPEDLFLYHATQNGAERKYSLKKKSTVRYAYAVQNLRTPLRFRIGNEAYKSQPFEIAVLQRPAIAQFRIVLNYPAYTGLGTDTLPPNVGDFSALYGTRADWLFQFKGPVQSANFISSERHNIELNNGLGVHTRYVRTSEPYQIRLASDRGVENQDTVRYRIQAIEDQYPQLSIVTPAPEETLPQSGILLLTANASDDFGLTKARLVYRYTKSNDPTKTQAGPQYLSLPLKREGNAGQIDAPLDFYEIGIAEGDELEYYVEVFDNDGFRGPKSTKSALRKVSRRSVQDAYEAHNETGQAVEESLANLLREAQANQKAIDELKKKMLEKKRLDYEDRKALKEAVEQQKEIQNKADSTSQKLEQQLQNAQEQNLLTPEAQEKLKQLQELVKSIKDPESLKQLEDLLNNLPKMDRQQLQRQLENMDDAAKQMEQSIEATMKLIQRLKVQQKVQEMVKKLDDHIQRQEMLKQQNENATEKPERQSIAEEQRELEQDFNEVQKDLIELQELKEEAGKPDPDAMQELQEKADQTQQQMQQAGQQMQQNQEKKSQQSQQGAQQSMQEMQEQLAQMQMQNEQQQQAENIDDLRQLLENLVKLSFDQEAVRDATKSLRYNDPQLTTQARKQDLLVDDFGLVEDSLRALAGRATEIEAFVLEEVNAAKRSLRRVLDFLGEKQIPAAAGQQHQTMVHLNRLAAMLTEALEKMQASMMQMQGMAGAACQNPNSQGQGQQSIRQIGDQQGQLNDKMRQGKGQQGGMTPAQMKAFAEQQGQLRKALQEMYKKLQEQGNDGLGNLGEIAREMQQSEEELKSQRLSGEFLERQQRILSRLLDFDKAMRKREFDDQRRGKTGEQIEKLPPNSLSPEQLLERMRREQIRQQNLRYSRTYQNLIDSYYNRLETPAP